MMYRKLKEMIIINTHFIVLSHHRSGTNFLCNLLCANKEVVCLNEPLSMHTNFFKQKDLLVWKKEEYNKGFLHSSLKGNELLIDYLKELRNYMTNESVNRAIGFKETMLFEKMTWLKEFMPNLKVIYLVRDPRAVVNSVMRNNMYKIWDYETILPRYIDSYLSDIKSEVDFSNPFNLAVWSWKIRHNLFLWNQNLFDSMVIRLEDIVNEPIENANKIMTFLDREVSKEQEEFLSKVYGDTKKGKQFSVFTTKDRVLNDWKSGVSKENEIYIIQTLRKEMEELGYI